MKRAEYLQIGDKIGIVASARKVSSLELKEAIDIFTHWGLESILGENIFKEHHQFAGTDEERLSDLQTMLDDDQIKAISFARGGYGTVRILDKIDWSAFIKKPKWLIGFSDITVIHSCVTQNLGVESIHAIMPLNFDTASNEAIISLRKSLFGDSISYEINSHPLNRKGDAKATLIGGNLSMIHTLTGSNADINTEGKILFIEDLDEYLYHIDRMLINLKRSGKLSKLKGLIIGGMTIMNDNTIPFGKQAYEIIQEHTAEYNYPICFDFPAGHFPDNRALIIGRNVQLSVGEKARLVFD